MKFGYHTIRWGLEVAQAFPEILDTISKAGFKGFESHQEDISPFLDDKNKFLSILSEKEMQMVSVYVEGSFIRGDTGFIYHIRRGFPLKKEIRKITRIAEFAASVGCTRLVLGGGKKRKTGVRKEDYVEMAKTLNKIGKKCNNVNIQATYHPHPETIVENRGQIDKLYELVDPDLVYLTIDTAHLTLSGADIIETINTYRERINHIHFKDLKNGRFVELGEGTINFSAIINSLKSVGYRDWIIVEDEVNSPAPLSSSSVRTPLESAKNGRIYIDTYLR